MHCQQLFTDLMKQNVDLGRPRSNSLTLRGLTLDSRDCESLEDVLKFIPLKMLDLTESNPDEEVNCC